MGVTVGFERWTKDGFEREEGCGGKKGEIRGKGEGTKIQTSVCPSSLVWRAGTLGEAIRVHWTRAISSIINTRWSVTGRIADSI